MPNTKNFAYGTVLTAPSPATSGTSLVVNSGQGAGFPSVSFNATIWPAGVRPTSSNAEVVTVTNISTDTFTITRAQESSSARTVIVGDQIAATITAGLFPTGTIVGTTDSQTVSSKVLSDTFMGKWFDTRITQQNTTLGASQDYLVDDILENSASYSVELPATSTLEVVPVVKQYETQSYFAFYDTVESGCVWTADSAGSSLNATMTDGYVWINGRRLRVNGVRSRAFTASRDTYVDFSDAGNGTATVTYTENTNNLSTGSPTLAAGSLRNAIIVSGANIAAATSINQGQETMVLPIVSSIAYSVTDSLGNLICPRDPHRKIIGIRQITTSATQTATSATQVTGLSCPVIVPAGRKVKITLYSQQIVHTVGGGYGVVTIWDGAVGGTQLQLWDGMAPTAGNGSGACVIVPTTPAAGAHTYNVGFHVITAGTGTLGASATGPAYIMVEII